MLQQQQESHKVQIDLPASPVFVGQVLSRKNNYFQKLEKEKKEGNQKAEDKEE